MHRFGRGPDDDDGHGRFRRSKIRFGYRLSQPDC